MINFDLSTIEIAIIITIQCVGIGGVVIMCIYIRKLRKMYCGLSSEYVILHTKYRDAQKYIEHLNEQNNILQAQALTDSATGLWNKRYFDVIMGKEISRIMRMASGFLTLLVLDIDNYKNVNDSLGHKFGDLLAVEFANLLKKVFRSSDYIFRIGGDEYAVFMLDAGKDTVNMATQRVLAEIKQITIEGKDIGSLIDVSIGASSFDHTNPNNDILHEADMRMYKIKEAKKRAQKAGA